MNLFFLKPKWVFLLLFFSFFYNLSAQHSRNTSELMTGVVFGTVKTENGMGIGSVTVTLSGISTFETSTDGNGYYIFEDVPQDGGYSLILTKQDIVFNGLSTFDLVLISKNILGVQPLGSPYKLIAADANNSGTVTIADLIVLRNLILGNFETFPNNTVWRFIDADYIFPNPEDPWTPGLPEVINIYGTDWQEIETNFIGIKIGDVNGSVMPD